jgi:peptidyl-tRNA hydrolase ICT1
MVMISRPALQLHQLVFSVSTAAVKKEPSEEQKRRVASLERAERNHRRKEKGIRSQVKKGRAAGRGGGGWD